ncbi:MAG: AraC family transcriptional regulator [Muribaculaceae bacterium]|nr:AraC family transcriptional regulator [Muribaculaceae bacterium]
MEQTINFDLISGIKAIMSDYDQMDDAYLVAHFDENSTMNVGTMDYAMRMDGMTMLFVRTGRIDLELNMDQFTAEGPAVCVLNPSCRMRATTEQIRESDWYVLFMSQRFLQSININMSAFNLPAMVDKVSPVIGVSEAEMQLMEDYLSILRRNCRDSAPQQLAMSTGSSLVSALIYELAKLQYRRVHSGERSESERQRNPRMAYVGDFLKLVRAHYAQERSVAFYASKLYISPKYLSLVVKEATGRSAARWIDEFVLMEAKNMLRYSGKNIQQVAYALNFSNQSAFGKYFKHLTGMSPTEYQKS